mmetsp:Transcript_30/g.78  ORF Transcript_30/g.78 Transcript_30/m.78 type:complete len:388 (+) Transcript_30:80-1243(+)|eukprot:CAMPEP_0195518824 /NCGR_PEP_ID=MMETSP0794_2-20130614/13745_1 /TAXON_ID=515487 /ORGANISM="Stephanopyxis turris, Strain CCMP 815" /LENGTH=387 /DNA_ID=CAMNT_0040647853 /DNA_START=78 /DNA_END=1241 /DNA_ORIENTATION=+
MAGPIAKIRKAKKKRKQELARKRLEEEQRSQGNNPQDMPGLTAADAAGERPDSPDSETDRREYCSALKYLRKVCGATVENEKFQLAIVTLIIINSVMMGLATFDFVELNEQISRVFEIVDFIFLVIFTVELLIQFIYLDIRLFKDGWLVFDFFVVVFSWLFSHAKIVRAFRIFRALRLLARVEILRNLVEALLSVIPRMIAIFLLLVLVFYIFAVMFTQLFMDTYEKGITSDNYFSSLDLTLFTLFQIMTMDGWAGICREIMVEYSWAWLPFVWFVVISGFVVVNLIIAVICDAIAVLHEQGAIMDDDDFNADPDTFDVASEKSSDDGNRTVEQLKAQVDDLTNQVEELMQSQEQSYNALEFLTQQLLLSETVSPNVIDEAASISPE